MATVLGPDDYHVCRGLVALLLGKDLRYPVVQITCHVDVSSQRPVYVVGGNALAKAVLSPVLEEMLGRSFAPDGQWRLDADDAVVLAAMARCVKEQAA